MEKISPQDSNTLAIIARYCKATDLDAEIRAELEEMLQRTSTDAKQIGEALLDPQKEYALDPEHAELTRLQEELEVPDDTGSRGLEHAGIPSAIDSARVERTEGIRMDSHLR